MREHFTCGERSVFDFDALAKVLVRCALYVFVVHMNYVCTYTTLCYMYIYEDVYRADARQICACGICGRFFVLAFFVPSSMDAVIYRNDTLCARRTTERLLHVCINPYLRANTLIHKYGLKVMY